MKKRNFFEELMQGFEELKRESEGKLMLRNQDVSMRASEKYSEQQKSLTDADGECGN